MESLGGSHATQLSRSPCLTYPGSRRWELLPLAISKQLRIEVSANIPSSMEVQNTTLGQLENGYSDFQPKRPSTAPEIIVTLPQADEGKDVLQDAEIVEVVIKQRIRIHDYNTLYAYPGLYE